MLYRETAKRRLVSQDGCHANATLCGVGNNNQGLRLQVLQPQTTGFDGPISGGFLLLDVGDNRHTATLMQFLGRVTSAPELLAALRERSPACIHVVNAGGLAVEVEHLGS